MKMLRINFIPEQVAAKRSFRRRAGRWGLIVGFSVLLLAVPLMMDLARRAEAADLREQHAHLVSDLASARQELQRLSDRARQVRIQLERADALRAKRPWSGLLAVLARELPQECWLTKIETDPVQPPQGTRVWRSQKDDAKPGVARSGRDRDKKEQPEELVFDTPRRLKITGYAAEATHPYVYVVRLRETGLFESVVLEESSREIVYDGAYLRFLVRCSW